jgi:serine protease Do
MKGLLLFALVLALPPSAAGAKFVRDWAATRGREFEAGLNPLALGPSGPLYRVRPDEGRSVHAFSALGSFAPLSRALSPAVVNISALGTDPGAAGSPLGSGFIIDPDGYVLTNDHAVIGGQQIRVRLNDGREFGAQVLGDDRSVDLALLHLVGDLKNLPFAYLGDSDALEVGDWVVAIGSPFGLDHSVSHGMISAKERVLGVGAFDDFIQTDALINPGNSGGPLFNMNGEVVGVNTDVFTRGRGIGFATPINLVKDLLPNLKVNGHVVRGWMGLSVKQRPDGGGPLVDAVYAGGPAAEAGVHPGDRITALNDRPVASYLQLLRRVELLPPGTRARLTLLRDGRARQVEVFLSKRPVEADTLVALQELEPSGLTVQQITPTLVSQLNLPAEAGLWVSGVLPGSTADLAGLRQGDLIDQLDGRPVKDVAGYGAALRTRSGRTLTIHLLRGGRPMTLVVRD